SQSDLVDVLALAREGRITGGVEEYALEETPLAYERLARGHVRGRAVVTPARAPGHAPGRHAQKHSGRHEADWHRPAVPGHPCQGGTVCSLETGAASCRAAWQEAAPTTADAHGPARAPQDGSPRARGRTRQPARSAGTGIPRPDSPGRTLGAPWARPGGESRIE